MRFAIGSDEVTREVTSFLARTHADRLKLPQLKGCTFNSAHERWSSVYPSSIEPFEVRKDVYSKEDVSYGRLELLGGETTAAAGR